jgi:apolipoprotein N-acyltransferase
MNKKEDVSNLIFRMALASVSALLLVLAFPGFNLSFLAWIGMVPLFFALEGKKAGEAFLIAYTAGIVFFLGTVWWLIHVTLPGMIVLVLYLGLFFGGFGAIASLGLSPSKNISNRALDYMALFLIPAAWVTCEWMRSTLFSGFGWVALGYSQSSSLPVIQIADITGVYGVSFIIVMVNIAIFITLKSQQERGATIDISMALAIIIVFISLGYGYFRMNNIFTGEKIKVSVIQGNIPQDKKWDSAFRSFIMDKYEDLTKKAVKRKVDLVVWPETSVPGFVESEPDLFERIQKLAIDGNTPLLVGTLREDRNVRERYYNSASLFLGNGNIEATYDKIHLVPFGEYIPLKKVFSFVEKIAPAPIGDVTNGKDHTVFSFIVKRVSKDEDVTLKLTKKIKFSCLVCFEDMFPEIAREFVKRGAGFLVNITNDAWYKKTSAAWQHAQGSIFRAVENRVAVVRATNTGISCFIDQKGRVTSVIQDNKESLFVDGYGQDDVLITNIRTFYNLYGDVFAYICIFATILLLYAAILLK